MAIVNRFENSDNTVSAHCRNEGIWESQFYAWKNKYFNDEQHDLNTDFIQVKPPTSIMPLEIILPNGIQLKWAEALPDSNIIKTLMSL